MWNKNAYNRICGPHTSGSRLNTQLLVRPAGGVVRVKQQLKININDVSFSISLSDAKVRVNNDYFNQILLNVKYIPLTVPV